jgi:hypothetical protein
MWSVIALFAANLVRAEDDPPSWYMVASEDRVISPKLEAMMAQTISAETITVHSSHVIMRSRPAAVADYITHAAHRRD